MIGGGYRPVEPVLVGFREDQIEQEDKKENKKYLCETIPSAYTRLSKSFIHAFTYEWTLQ